MTEQSCVSPAQPPPYTRLNLTPPHLDTPGCLSPGRGRSHDLTPITSDPATPVFPIWFTPKPQSFSWVVLMTLIKKGLWCPAEESSHSTSKYELMELAGQCGQAQGGNVRGSNLRQAGGTIRIAWNTEVLDDLQTCFQCLCQFHIHPEAQRQSQGRHDTMCSGIPLRDPVDCDLCNFSLHTDNLRANPLSDSCYQRCAVGDGFVSVYFPSILLEADYWDVIWVEQWHGFTPIIPRI